MIDGASPRLDLGSIEVTYPPRGGIPAVRALDGISLIVDRREMVVVAGRSGSGKSTLLRVAAGLLEPTSGSVCWSGVDVGDLDESERTRMRGREIGYAFQGGGLIDSLTALENVAVSAVVRRIPHARERAEEALATVGLGDRRTHFPTELSGGEQQRVAIARALFGDPPLLLIDEPTANLDRDTADGIIDLCLDLSASGSAVLIASHDEVLIGDASRVHRLEHPGDRGGETDSHRSRPRLRRSRS
jgi:putative ABC transport system ATP-binding protein